jgi:hypothetical protein
MIPRNCFKIFFYSILLITLINSSIQLFDQESIQCEAIFETNKDTLVFIHIQVLKRNFYLYSVLEKLIFRKLVVLIGSMKLKRICWLEIKITLGAMFVELKKKVILNFIILFDA